MTLAMLLEKIRSCDPIVIVLGILSLVEITPIKISPLRWIGERINKPLKDEIENMKLNSQIGLSSVQKDIKDIKESSDDTRLSLQNHIAESMRQEILNFQNSCLRKSKHTKEEWTYIHKLCGKYDEHISANNLQNSEVEEAIHYIKRVYRKILEDGNFIDFLEQDKENE